MLYGVAFLPLTDVEENLTFLKYITSQGLRELADNLYLVNVSGVFIVYSPIVLFAVSLYILYSNLYIYMYGRFHVVDFSLRWSEGARTRVSFIHDSGIHVHLRDKFGLRSVETNKQTSAPIK